MADHVQEREWSGEKPPPKKRWWPAAVAALIIIALAQGANIWTWLTVTKPPR